VALDFHDDRVALIGVCAAEEALELVDWLCRVERPTADLSACTNLHAAILQTLLAYQPVIAAPPTDPFLVRWILPLLTAAHAVS
jgi:hypothetical protein